VSVLAMAFPILPGKTEAWRTWMAELNGPRHEGFIGSRRRAGLHEQTFLQQTPAGDTVIVTLEGDDPQHAFEKMVSGTDPFTTWFVDRAKEFHGVDLKGPMDSVHTELVVDSGAAAVPA
jgi:Family of unknown function (DUF6176)